MRKLLLLLISSALVHVQASAQRMSIPTLKSGAGASLPTNLYAPNAVGSSNGPIDIQVQYKEGQWTRGNVKFKNGQEAKNILLVFDVHGNKLYFKQGETTMEFTYPIYEFEIGLLLGQDTAVARYRSSYPAVNSNTDETFYEVVVDGSKMHLLWCRAKNVKMYKDESVPEQRRSTEKEQWYVYLPEGKMIKIKKDKADIMKALPEHAALIETIIKGKDLRVKEPEDLITLFATLNGL